MSKPNILRVDDPRAIEMLTNHRTALREQLVAEGLGGPDTRTARLATGI